LRNKIAKELLTNTPVTSLLKAKELVVTVQSSEKVSVALTKLVENKISALPIRDANNSESFGSFIDTVDICTYIMQTIEKNAGDIAKAEATIAETTCGQVSNKGEKDPFQQVLCTDNLRTCIGKMVALADIHRLPVFDLKGNFVGILSQSNVINMISENIKLFSMITNKNVSDLRLGIKQVLSVNISQPIKDAFKLIADNGISGVGVVNDTNELVGNVSASDIKVTGAFCDGSFQKLNTPIKDILGETMAKKKPIFVVPSATISEVITIMSKEKIHRIFVVKERSNELIGVISLIDLLNLISLYA